MGGCFRNMVPEFASPTSSQPNLTVHLAVDRHWNFREFSRLPKEKSAPFQGKTAKKHWLRSHWHPASYRFAICFDDFFISSWEIHLTPPTWGGSLQVGSKDSRKSIASLFVPTNPPGIHHISPIFSVPRLGSAPMAGALARLQNRLLQRCGRCYRPRSQEAAQMKRVKGRGWR